MINILAKFHEQIKPYKEGLFLIGVIMIIGLIGFGLGRLSAKYSAADLKINSTITNAAAMAKLSQPETAQGGSGSDQLSVSPEAGEQRIVGNTKSKIYHLENCPGASKLSAINKVFFASILEAQKAGFRPAGNCPELQ